MKKIWPVIAVLLLSACDGAKNPENAHVQQEAPSKPVEAVKFHQDLQVSPEMQDYPIYEIGVLIKQLMLDQGQTFYDWSHLANDQHIKWVTDGYKESFNAYQNKTITQREGLVRVHILGDRVGQLRDRNYETPWKLNYQGESAKFGVKQIDLNPNGDFLTFPDPIPSLKKQNIMVSSICHQQVPGGGTQVYVLKAKNKQDMYLIDQESGGSGGSNRWLTLQMEDQSTEWCPDDGPGVSDENSQ